MFAFRYKWLQQVQAKESVEISNEILDSVMNELYRQRVIDINDITPKRIREVLKVLKLRKAYEHVAQITSKLTGKKPLRVPSHVEEMCRLMFIAVQPVFEKHCPKDRKNFLSYSVCSKDWVSNPWQRIQIVTRFDDPFLPPVLTVLFIQIFPIAWV